jgi:murein DD-endopeptidase MepM/ murein hydrolase activator NlpD
MSLALVPSLIPSSPPALSFTLPVEPEPEKPASYSMLFARLPRSQEMAWPAPGPVSSEFGPKHPLGIDIGLALDPRASITASAGGIVTFAGGRFCCSYGYYVEISHPSGLTTLYGHLSKILVTEGQVVSRGDVIGIGGSTGLSRGGAHLHFEVRDGKTYLNPLDLLPPRNWPESVASLP